MWEDLAISDDRPLEYSEDRRRGDRPELRKLIDAVRGRLTSKVDCSRCKRGHGTHLIDTFRSPRVVCRDCFWRWADMTPVERRRER